MADKKISELPLITTISGSIVYVPIVHDGITEKITVEDFSKFTNKYAAQTGSVNIFTANQTINANLSVNGTSTVSGNASVGGNLVVNGKLTAQELFTEITSASIIFESGSTIFGNSADDTHQFTGVVSINGTTIGAQALNEFTASQLAVNLRIASTTGSINTTTSSFNSEFIKIGLTTSSIHFTTQSLNTQTGSQDLVNLRISSTTGSINTTTSSFDSVFLRISSTTGSINTTTSSFDSVFLRIASTTGSINTTTSSFDSVFLRISSTTGSINTTTSSFDSVFLGISSVTGAMNTTTSSFDSVFLRISSTTGSINTTTSSFNTEFIKIGSTTSSIHFTTQSLNTQTGSQQNLNAQIGIATGSLNAFTSSVIGQTNTISTFTASINFTTASLNTFTGSTRIELNSIEAYTASLKNAITVNGSNVQIIGELNVNKLNVQYISSSVLLTSGSNIFGDAVSDKHEFTGSVNIKDTLFVNGQAIGLGELNAFSGSQIGKDFTLSVVTSSIDAHILKQATQTGSQDLVNFNISVVTSSIDSHILKQATQTGSQDLVNYNISIVTSSIDAHILKQATQTGSQDLVNLGISTFTGSLRSEVNLIEAYTASLKGAAIVSSSNQIPELFRLMQATASLNTYTGSNDSVVARILQTTASLNTLTGSMGAVVNSVMAYTSSLKSAFTVSGTTTTHNGPVNLSDNTIYSHFSQPANVTSGNTTVYTYTQTSGEYCAQFEYSLVSLYAPSGTNLFGVAHGFAYFMADGSTNASYKSANIENGWSVAVAATNAGSFTITFTAGGSATHSNINLRVRKVNRTGAG